MIVDFIRKKSVKGGYFSAWSNLAGQGFILLFLKVTGEVVDPDERFRAKAWNTT